MPNHNGLASILTCAELLPSHIDVYPASNGISREYDLPSHVRPGAERTYDAAISYVHRLLPGVEVEPFSNEGRTAVVLHDGHYAYKVFRQRSRGYGLVENEVAALQVLSGEGIAPRPVALIDAAPEHRFRYVNARDHGMTPLFGGNVVVPRIKTNGHLPIIVTEIQDVGPISELPKEKLTAEFDRFARVALRHSVLYEDCRFMYDRAQNKAIVIDVGEVYDPRQYASEDDSNLRDAELVQNALVRFGKGVKTWPALEVLAPAAYPDRITQLHPVLYEYLGLASQATT